MFEEKVDVANYGEQLDFLLGITWCRRTGIAHVVPRTLFMSGNSVYSRRVRRHATRLDSLPK